MITRGDLLQEAMQHVAARDAEVLLAHVLQISRAQLFAFPEKTVPVEAASQFRLSVADCAAGMPVAYLTGTREFWSLPLQVTRDTLIPRPETEHLVEVVLQQVTAKRAIVADCGTGSGAIALALASERPAWEIHATDSSVAALRVAEDNAKRLGITTVQFHAGHWCEPLPARAFDAIVSNPPYLATDDPHLAALVYEPQGALVSGREGLDAIQLLASMAEPLLAPQGLLCIEHGCDQGARVRQLFEAAGYQDIRTENDWQGHERITLARKGSSSSS